MYYRRKEELKRIRRNIAKQSTYFIPSGGYYFSARKNRYQRVKYGKYRRFFKKNCNKRFRTQSKLLNTQISPGSFKKYSEFWYKLL